MSHRRLPSRPPRTLTPHEVEVEQILTEGRAERARQAREQPPAPWLDLNARLRGKSEGER
jgi:hypothetical protein